VTVLRSPGKTLLLQAGTRETNGLEGMRAKVAGGTAVRRLRV